MNEIPETPAPIQEPEVAKLVAQGEPTPAAKPKSAKKPPKKDGSGKTQFFSFAQATQQSLKTGEGTATGAKFVLPIAAIADYKNPRHEPEALYQQGYALFGESIDAPVIEEGKITQYASLIQIGLSAEIDKARQYVALIEQYEGSISRLLNPDGKEVLVDTEKACEDCLAKESTKKGWKIEKHPTAPQSIVELATDIARSGQLDPIEVTKSGTHYVGVDGGRRIAAILYLHCKTMVLRHDKDEDAPAKVWAPVVEAIELACKKDEVYDLSIELNLSRKQFTPLQEAQIYHEMLKRENPETGKSFTMKEAASKLNIHYATFRNREALARPYVPAKKNSEGIIVEPSKGLTDEDRKKLARGEILPTAASRKALGELSFTEAETPKKKKKARALTLKEMQALFDTSPEKQKDRRQAIAECMGLTVVQAEKESELRIMEAERRELNAQDRKKKSNKGKK